MKSRRSFAVVALLFFFVAVLFFGGCVKIREGIWDWKGKPESTPDTPPQEMLAKGQYYYQEGLFKKAVDEYQKIKQFHPLSGEYVMLSALGVADSCYRLKEYSDALISYSDFINLYPTSEKIPYCIYQMGMCHYEQLQDIEKDQTATTRARQEFEKLIACFPNSGYASEAERKVKDCLDRLAQSELYLAVFYIKRGNYEAAISRLEGMLKNFPNNAPLISSEYILNSARRLAFDKKRSSSSEIPMLGSSNGSYKMTEYERERLEQISEMLGGGENAHKVIFNLAWKDYENKKYASAMHRANLAWLLNNGSFQVYHLFGLLIDKQRAESKADKEMENIDTAIYCFQKALAINPDHAASAAYLARYYGEKIAGYLATPGGYSKNAELIAALEKEADSLFEKALATPVGAHERGMIKYFFAKFLAIKGEYAMAWENIEETRRLGRSDLLDSGFVKEVGARLKEGEPATPAASQQPLLR